MSLDPHRYLQRGCIRGDVSGPDIDTARRTNRFASNAGCAYMEHCPACSGCDVRRINIVICSEQAATGGADDESSDQENKTALSDDHRNRAETAGYLEVASSVSITMPQNTNFEEDLKNPLTSTLLRAEETDSQETRQAAKTMQDKSVRTEFTKDASSDTRSKTLLDLLRDDRVQPQRCFCSEPRIIPCGTRRIIALNTMRNIPVCPRWNGIYACKKINGRKVARYRQTSNDVGINDFYDASESEVQNRSFDMYSNSFDYEMSRAEMKRSNHVVQTISRNHIKNESSCRRDSTEHNLNTQNVRKEWTYIGYLIDDTLKLLGSTNAMDERIDWKLERSARRVTMARDDDASGAISNDRFYEARISTGLD